VAGDQASPRAREADPLGAAWLAMMAKSPLGPGSRESRVENSDCRLSSPKPRLTLGDGIAAASAAPPRPASGRPPQGRALAERHPQRGPERRLRREAVERLARIGAEHGAEPELERLGDAPLG